MKPEQKAEIAKYIGLYKLTEEQKTAAEGFILPAAMFLKSYLRRLDPALRFREGQQVWQSQT